MVDDRDELLVRKFFEERRVDVPDDGFSRRVMQGLPNRARLISRMWAAVCLLSGVLMFVLCGWAGKISTWIKGLEAVLPQHSVLIGMPYLLWLLLLSVIFVGGYKAITSE